jgi:two-component system sensor histidine kinase KdpD
VLVRTSVPVTLARWTVAAGLLAAIVYAYTHAIHANITTVALTLLLLIQWFASYWGLGLAAVASLAAALSFNYFFLPPVGTFSIADTQNWIALLAFLAAALIGSNLANRLHAASAASERREHELELLYDFSQRLLAPDNAAQLLRVLPYAIADAFRCTTAAVYLLDGSELHTSGLKQDVPVERLHAAAMATAPFAGPAPGSVFVALAVGVRPIGAIYLACDAEEFFPHAPGLPSAGTLEAMSSLVALSLERATALEKLVDAQASAQSDRLRATLLDSVTHDLRTPLTSIKASVTSLLSQTTLKPDQRQELLTVIDEESDRLNHLIAEAIEMAQLDAKAVRLDPRPHALAQLLGDVLASVRSRWPDRAVSLVTAKMQSEPLPDAFADEALIAKVLLHLVENAAKYSTPGTPIRVSIERRGAWLEVSVADQGPGVPPKEQERIFDKFYRNPAHRYRVQGSGMGLPIARAIVEAHGGTLTLNSAPGAGSTFRFTVPCAERAARQPAAE